MILENPKHPLTGFVHKASVQMSPQEQLSDNWGFASSFFLS
jgi:hypothetical protein